MYWVYFEFLLQVHSSFQNFNMLWSFFWYCILLFCCLKSSRDLLVYLIVSFGCCLRMREQHSLWYVELCFLLLEVWINVVWLTENIFLQNTGKVLWKLGSFGCIQLCFVALSLILVNFTSEGFNITYL